MSISQTPAQTHELRERIAEAIHERWRVRLRQKYAVVGELPDWEHAKPAQRDIAYDNADAAIREFNVLAKLPWGHDA